MKAFIAVLSIIGAVLGMDGIIEKETILVVIGCFCIIMAKLYDIERKTDKSQITYYPKEFAEWLFDNDEFEISYRDNEGILWFTPTWKLDGKKEMTLDELYQYWLTIIKNK